MKTVKEVSKLTGISVRTLHYYDEIGLLRPTACTEAGYRLYDDKALERLKQILFFKEFDMPLKDIHRILLNPDFDRNQILGMQRAMLVKKRDRLNSLIDSIDRMMKGETDMDFTVFGKEEVEDLYQAMISHMTEEQIKAACQKYGSLEAYHDSFIEKAGSGQAQKNFQKVVEWYGDKDSAVKAGTNPPSQEILNAYQNRMENIMKRLAEKKGADVSSYEVKSLMGEYDFVAKQLFQMPDVSRMMLEMAEAYQKDSRLVAALDAQYGAGMSVYIGKAIKGFYVKK